MVIITIWEGFRMEQGYGARFWLLYEDCGILTKNLKAKIYK